MEMGALDGALVANGQPVELLLPGGGTHAVSAMAVDRADNVGAAANQIEAFLNELEAQRDKAVNPQAYDLLRADALYVLAHLG